MSQAQTPETNERAQGGEDPTEEIRAIVEQARREVESFVRERPHAALGIAAACGFILGGGLTPRRLLRLGFMLGGPIISKELMGQAASWVADQVPADLGRGRGEPS